MSIQFGSTAGPAYDPRGAIRTILTALLGNQFQPTGLGTNAPQALGPSPVRGTSEIPGLASGATPSGSDIWSILGPIIHILGGGAGNIAQTGQVNVTAPQISEPAQNFLSRILQSVLSPAAPAPIRSAAPAAAPVPAAGNPAASIFDALFGQGDSVRGMPGAFAGTPAGASLFFGGERAGIGAGGGVGGGPSPEPGPSGGGGAPSDYSRGMAPGKDPFGGGAGGGTGAGGAP